MPDKLPRQFQLKQGKLDGGSRLSGLADQLVDGDRRRG